MVRHSMAHRNAASAPAQGESTRDPTAKIASETEVANLRALDAAKADGERARVDVYRDLPSDILLGLSLREVAGRLPSIEHLTLSPDLLGPALARLGRGAE